MKIPGWGNPGKITSDIENFYELVWMFVQYLNVHHKVLILEIICGVYFCQYKNKS